MEVKAAFAENHVKPINTLYGQNAELVNIESGWYI
jgi:hypothetical protein